MNDIIDQVTNVLGWTGSLLGVIGFFLLVIACLVSLFKIDEADDYFGQLASPEQLHLKGLPFSFSRMGVYGLAILFWETRIAKKMFSHADRKLIHDSPLRLRRLLVYLYANCFICLLSASFFISLRIVIKML